MNYYIKEIKNENNRPTGYFAYPKLKIFNVHEEHGRWLIDGKISMYSDSVLPYYSFYMNVDTSYFKVSDIKLEYANYYRTYSTYRIDDYNFAFAVSLSNSILYQTTCIDTHVLFNFSFYFNQNILKEFSVKYNNDDVQRLVLQLNQVNIEAYHYFTNTFVLNYDKQYFENYGETTTNIGFKVPNYLYLSSPIDNLVIIDLNRERQLRIKQMKINLKYQIGNEETWNEYEEKIEELVYYGKSIPITLPYSYNFNPKSKTFERTTFNGHKGFYIPYISKGFIEIQFVMDTENEDKKVVINREFSFTDNTYDQALNTLHCNAYTKSLKKFEEVKYGK